MTKEKYTPTDAVHRLPNVINNNKANIDENLQYVLNNSVDILSDFRYIMNAIDEYEKNNAISTKISDLKDKGVNVLSDPSNMVGKYKIKASYPDYTIKDERYQGKSTSDLYSDIERSIMTKEKYTPTGVVHRLPNIINNNKANIDENLQYVLNNSVDILSDFRYIMNAIDEYEKNKAIGAKITDLKDKGVNVLSAPSGTIGAKITDLKDKGVNVLSAPSGTTSTESGIINNTGWTSKITSLVTDTDIVTKNVPPSTAVAVATTTVATTQATVATTQATVATIDPENTAKGSKELTKSQADVNSKDTTLQALYQVIGGIDESQNMTLDQVKERTKKIFPWLYNQVGKGYSQKSNPGLNSPTHDCSSLGASFYLQYGVIIPRNSTIQHATLTRVNWSDIRIGDLLYFETDKTRPNTVSHVGVYVGNGFMIHAKGTKYGVVWEQVRGTNREKLFRGGGRVFINKTNIDKFKKSLEANSMATDNKPAGDIGGTAETEKGTVFDKSKSVEDNRSSGAGTIFKDIMEAGIKSLTGDKTAFDELRSRYGVGKGTGTETASTSAVTNPDGTVTTTNSIANTSTDGLKPLLDQISKGEGTVKDGYDAVFGHSKFNPNGKKVSTMTIDEVLSFQDELLANQKGVKGRHSSAVGKYQMLKMVLEEEKRIQKLPGNTLFDGNAQETIIINRLNRMRKMNKWMNGEITDDQFHANLSLEFASIAKPGTSTSAHGQAVGTSSADIRTAMAAVKGAKVTTPSTASLAVKNDTTVTSATSTPSGGNPALAATETATSTSTSPAISTPMLAPTAKTNSILGITAANVTPTEVFKSTVETNNVGDNAVATVSVDETKTPQVTTSNQPINVQPAEIKIDLDGTNKVLENTNSLVLNKLDELIKAVYGATGTNNQPTATTAATKNVNQTPSGNGKTYTPTVNLEH